MVSGISSIDRVMIPEEIFLKIIRYAIKALSGHNTQPMKEYFGPGNTTPLLLIRLGYAAPMPYSFRRNIGEFILNI